MKDSFSGGFTEKRARSAGGKNRQVLRFVLIVSIVVVSSLLALALQSSQLGTWIEQKTYDLRFILRGDANPSESTPVVILAVDEQSLQEIPDPLMFWQKHFAGVIDGLVKADAGAIGVDFIFRDISTYDRSGQQELVEAILRARSSGLPVVLAYRVRGDHVEQPPVVFTLAAGENSFAYANLTTDSDDFVRRQEIFAYDENGRQSPGFALAVARAYSENSIQVPENVERTVLINYRGRHYFPRVSFARALQAARSGDEDYFRKTFHNRVVLIGRVGQAGDEDLHSTPFYHSQNLLRGQSRRTPGIEIHANVISTLLQGDFIRRLNPFYQTAITAGMIGLIGLTCFFFSPLIALLISGGLVLGYLLIAFFWAFSHGLWMLVVSPVVGAICAVTLSETSNYLLEGRAKRRLRNLFRRYVDDNVIERILQTPDDLVLEGERRRITVLFSDIRGFTSRSERDPAETVVAYLNEYFAAMVEAIHRNRGMVDKFIGDGIMAVFGAPLEDEDSAFHAVRAALDMIEALERTNESLKSQGVEPIGIGVGIHTGEAVVGNIGSPRKMDYTVIGDVVNTASRIESLTRKVDTDILISQEVEKSLGDRIPVESVGEHEVKGKTAKVPVYRVLPRVSRNLPVS